MTQAEQNPEDRKDMKPSGDKPGKGFTFTVNDTEFRTEEEKISALKILELAQDKKVIQGKAADYLLEAADGERPYKPDDEIDVSSNKRKFITVPNTPTKVA